MYEDTKNALKRLSENCLLVAVRVGVAGQTYTSSRASNDAAMVNNADANRLKTQVLKFTNSDLKPVRKERDDAKTLLNAVTSPWDSNGNRLIQVKTYQNIRERLDNHRARFYDLRDEFVSSYEAHKQKAREQLEDLYDDDRFPPAEEIRNQFYFDIEKNVITDADHICIEGTAATVEAIRDELNQRHVRKLNDANQELIDRMKSQLRKSQASIQRLHDKKQAGEDTRFYDSTITGICSLVDTLDDININKDPELTEFGNSIARVFDGLAINQLKESPTLREEVLEETDALVSAIESYTPNAFKSV